MCNFPDDNIVFFVRGGPKDHIYKQFSLPLGVRNELHFLGLLEISSHGLLWSLDLEI